MLRITEELLLLIMDAESGGILHSLTDHQRDLVIAGAVLMDLALENRIDTDSEQLFLIDPQPVDDELLDPTLLEIAGSSDKHDTAYWVKHTAGRSSNIRKRAQDRLIERGILVAEVGGLLLPSRLVARTRRYPSIDGQTREEVHSRVMKTLFSDDIPDPRDAMIIGLAAACGVFESILPRDELSEVQERIDTLSRLDLTGRFIRERIRTIEPTAPAEKTVRPPEEIPEVPGLPIAGNAFQMTGSVREFLAENYRKFGPIFRIRAFGFRFIALVGPEANTFLARISGTHLRSFEPYHDFSVAMGSHRSVLDMDGPEHVRMRKLQVNGYSPKTFEFNLDAARIITQRMIENLPQGQPVGIQRTMQQVIAEQVGVCLTGTSPREYIDDLVYFLSTAVSVHITKRLPRQFERLPKFRRAERRLGELYEKILEAHRPELRAGQQRDFVDDILEANRKDPQLMPETDLRGNILAPFAVGIDTSASVCAFMLYALLKHPDLLERMRTEVDEMFERGPLTPAGLRNLDVTRRTVLETLRIYPVIPALTRTISNSFEFGGYRVPAGSQALIGTTVSHHLPECFPDPDRFDIERFSKSAQGGRQPGAFAPFGLGRHRCIGSGFSELQIALTLAVIVRETDLVLDRPDLPLKIKQAPAPQPDASLRIRLVRRRN
ncbi:MAG: cytochrome P450 [Albidovulum sp.]|nr:cytochrome P450 [Albidovulum sp.]